MNLFVGILSFLFVLFLFPSWVFAKIEVYNSPIKIETNKEFELGVSLSNVSDQTHFLSIAFHKKSGNPYFGQTKNGDNWIEADDSNCKDFPQTKVTEGTWSGTLVGKFFYGEKDFDNTLGNYILKVFKYTDSCNKSASDDIAVELFDPDPPSSLTPTSLPTSVPTHTPKPTLTPSIIPAIKSISTQALVKITLSPTNVPSATMTFLSSSSRGKASIPISSSTTKSLVLGEAISQHQIDKKDEEKKEAGQTKKSNILVFPLLFVGIVCIIISCIWSYLKIKKSGKDITFFF